MASDVQRSRYHNNLRGRLSRSRSPVNRRNRNPSRNSRSPPSNFQNNTSFGDKNERRPSIGDDTHFQKIDRVKTCPFLLRVFCSQNRHHRLDEFARGNLPANELQIYTWKDATLKELMGLVKEVNPDARLKETYFDFAIVFADQRRGGFIMKDVGTTCSGVKYPDDAISLQSKKFQIGDYLDIAITPPRERRE